MVPIAMQTSPGCKFCCVSSTIMILHLVRTPSHCISLSNALAALITMRCLYLHRCGWQVRLDDADLSLAHDDLTSSPQRMIAFNRIILTCKLFKPHQMDEPPRSVYFAATKILMMSYHGRSTPLACCSVHPKLVFCHLLKVCLRRAKAMRLPFE